MAGRPSKRDIYQEITDRIVERLEAGDLPPWRQPLRRNSDDPIPKNLVSGKAYRGVNVWLLSLTAWMEGYGSSSWMTYRQAKAKGGQVRKGERGTLVTFWTEYAKTNPQTNEETKRPVLRHYTAFNVEQIEGVEPPGSSGSDASEFRPIERAERIVDGYAGSPSIEHRGARACYLLGEDIVRMPPGEAFLSAEFYYATLFHELTHSTGHSKRLGRGLDDAPSPFGSPDYSKEELVAEMGAAYLAATAGVSPPTIEQSASYIAGWLRSFRDDKKLIVHAAAQAQKAADHILGVSFDGAPSTTGDAVSKDFPQPQR